MTVELKKGYIIDSYYDKNTRSYITTLKDNEGNQIRDAYYSGNMTDRNADVQHLKEFFYEYMNEALDLKKSIKDTKEKTKKSKLPALSTLSPIMPDAAAGIDTFNSGVGLSEEWIHRDELESKLKKMGFKYNFARYTDEQLYRIYQERLKYLEKKHKEKEKKKQQENEAENKRINSKDSFMKNGIEFESEDAAREYFGESMHKNYYWDIDEIKRIIKQAWEDAGLILREDKIDISRHDNWCIVEIKYIDDWEFKHINKPMIRKALKKELDLYDVKQSSWRDTGWGNSDYGKTLRYDLYMYPPEEQEMNESLYLNDMHKAWDIEEDSCVKTLNENLNNNHEFKTITEGLKYFEKKEFDENYNDACLEALFEGVKSSLDQDDIRKLGNFLKKADDADEVNTYIKGLLSEDLEDKISITYRKSMYSGFTKDGDNINLSSYLDKFDEVEGDLNSSYAAILLKSTISHSDYYKIIFSDNISKLNKIIIDWLYNSSLSKDPWIEIHRYGMLIDIKNNKEIAHGDTWANEEKITAGWDKYSSIKSKESLHEDWESDDPSIAEMIAEDILIGAEEEYSIDASVYAINYNEENDVANIAIEVDGPYQTQEDFLYFIDNYFKPPVPESIEELVNIYEDEIDEDRVIYTLKVKFKNENKMLSISKEEFDKLLQDLLNRLAKVGFIVDENSSGITDNIMGGKHIQVINPNMFYPTSESEGEELTDKEAYQLFRDDLREIEGILDTFEDEHNKVLYITFNFGPNKNMVITGGIDIHLFKELK